MSVIVIEVTDLEIKLCRGDVPGLLRKKVPLGSKVLSAVLDFRDYARQCSVYDVEIEVDPDVPRIVARSAS